MEPEFHRHGVAREGWMEQDGETGRAAAGGGLCGEAGRIKARRKQRVGVQATETGAAFSNVHGSI